MHRNTTQRRKNPLSKNRLNWFLLCFWRKMNYVECEMRYCVMLFCFPISKSSPRLHAHPDEFSKLVGNCNPPLQIHFFASFVKVNFTHNVVNIRQCLRISVRCEYHIKKRFFALCFPFVCRVCFVVVVVVAFYIKASLVHFDIILNSVKTLVFVV